MLLIQAVYAVLLPLFHWVRCSRWSCDRAGPPMHISYLIVGFLGTCQACLSGKMGFSVIIFLFALSRIIPHCTTFMARTLCALPESQFTLTEFVGKMFVVATRILDVLIALPDVYLSLSVVSHLSMLFC